MERLPTEYLLIINKALDVVTTVAQHGVQELDQRYSRYYVGFAQINDDGRLSPFFVPIMHPSSEYGKESSENEKAGRDIITDFCSLTVV